MNFAIPPHWALVAGLLLSFVVKEDSPLRVQSKKWSGKILQGSIILLGAGLNFRHVLAQGPRDLLITLISIAVIIRVGHALAILFKVPDPVCFLISSGTAICGGSAIGALGPIMKADSFAMAVSLGIVFILNGISIFVFPPLGELLHLSQTQFGTWAALAIHDTSAVVAASQMYGEIALTTATTLKLTRALWILPLAFMVAAYKKTEGKPAIPWFIFIFLGMSLLFTFTPGLDSLAPVLTKTAKLGFAITLFFIGLGLSPAQLKKLQTSMILQGVTLWIFTLTASLIFVKYFIK